MKLKYFLRAYTLSLFLTIPCRADEPSKPVQPTKDTANIFYSGTVTERTKASITVHWPGEKPKKFPVSETLASGGIPKDPRLLPEQRQPYHVDDCFRYRLTDVQPGDIVVIAYAHLGELDICDHISIRKRTNGLVPPLPDGAVVPKKYPPGFKGLVPSMIPYHERMNAYWDLEDRGIPYPEKFGPYRRWPIAPMPREVKPDPATQP